LYSHGSGRSSAISFGVSQIIAGFVDEEIPYMGVKEALIRNTTRGLKKKTLLGANQLLDMLPDIASGRLRVNPSELSQVIDAIQYGLSIGKSGVEIQKELKEAGLLEPDECTE